MKQWPRLLLALVVAVSTCCVSGFGADKLFMKSGRIYEGRILNETDDMVTLQREGITIGFEKKLIDKIEREPVERTSNLMPGVEALLLAAQSVSPEEWVQIPATVIDEGVLRNVPYRSYRAGKLELNVYGDPASPAGVEIGIYGSTTALPFKKKLVAFIAEITNAEFPESFNLTQDKKRLGPIDYEVTPASAPDAYGAWWISAYDMSRLETARVADNEVNEITSQRAEVARVTAQEAAKKNLEAWTAADLARAVRPVEKSQSQPASYAASSSPVPGYGTGRVWVRGYTRKDGTYVRGYSRSR